MPLNSILGLDLSFATHIFLLDQLRDPALENQIISRAHRMGAKGPVDVTLLLANEVGWEDMGAMHAAVDVRKDKDGRRRVSTGGEKGNKVKERREEDEGHGFQFNGTSSSSNSSSSSSSSRVNKVLKFEV